MTDCLVKDHLAAGPPVAVRIRASARGHARGQRSGSLSEERWSCTEGASEGRDRNVSLRLSYSFPIIAILSTDVVTEEQRLCHALIARQLI